MKERDSFNNTMGAFVALVGSAIGLGNLWRFPYLVGTNGGAVFIIIYILCVLLLCLPVLISEYIVGRRSHANAYGAFKVLAPGSKWKYAGFASVICAVCILSFYCVVGGWTVDYLVKAMQFKFSIANTAVLENIFGGIVTSKYESTAYLLIFMTITGIVVMGGVKNGIEKCNKVLMPVLFILILAIIIRSLTLPGASQGLKFLFYPDFSKVTPNMILAALGQGFFSLSIGCGTVMTYASYIKKENNLVKTTTYTVLADTLFAILAGIAIMPAVFSYGISPSEGAGLAFVSLPYVFANMPLGGIVAILFFFILFIAALSSAISLLEVPTAYLKEEFKKGRKRAVLISLILITVLGILCSLSEGVLSGFKIFGDNLFDLFNNVSSNIFMTMCGILILVFVGWRMKKSDFEDEMTSGGMYRYKPAFLKTLRILIRYIAPAAVGLIMINALFF